MRTLTIGITFYAHIDVTTGALRLKHLHDLLSSLSCAGRKSGENDKNFDTLDLPKRTEPSKGKLLSFKWIMGLTESWQNFLTEDELFVWRQDRWGQESRKPMMDKVMCVF